MLEVDLYNNTYNTSLVTGDEYLDLVANADGASGNRYRIDLYILQLKRSHAIYFLVFVVSLCQVITGLITLKEGLPHLFRQIT